MSLDITWRDIAVRLMLTVIAGGLIGINREEHGQAAGLRTTLLVCLAACIAMIQANLLLGVVGKAPNSFVVLDLMRLPLGILSGMGFIGAAAVLRKGDMIRGVTTAATLWFATVMGLCFGGGQLGLGLGALALGLIILIVLKKVEICLKQDRKATLTIALNQKILGQAAGNPDQPVHILTVDEIINAMRDAGFKIRSSSVTMDENAVLREMTCEVNWPFDASETHPSRFLKELANRFNVARIDWRVVD